MIELFLIRVKVDRDSLLGKLELPKPLLMSFATLEPWPAVIPDGRYPLVYEWSPKFKRKLWEVKDVPGHSEIKIHNGNTRYAADEHGYVKEATQGCPLIGLKHGELWVRANGRNGLPEVNGLQPAVISSRLALSRFHQTMERCYGRNVYLRVESEYGD